MKKTVDFYFTQRLIDLMIKAAGVVLTSVATYQVASNTFAHLDAPWNGIVAIGALFLVEGAFVATWFAIDTQKQAPMAMKVSWAVTLITIYTALLVIGIVNGEGSAGWAFRLILAIMIGKSIYEAGVYEVLKSQRKSDQNIEKAYKVRRLKRKVEREKAIHALLDTNMEQGYRRELADRVDRARLDMEHEAAMIKVQLHREHLMERVHVKDNLARGQILARMAHQEREQKAMDTPLAEFARKKLEFRN
ncbi:MAG: hypothetical protein AB8G77_23660 [Rhodothermales bacterium]